MNAEPHEWTIEDLKPVVVEDMPAPAPKTREMINPNLLTPKSKRWNDPRFAGGKMYFAVMTGPVVVRARRVWKRAVEAETYATRLKERWIRLYDAAIVAMAKKSIPEEV